MHFEKSFQTLRFALLEYPVTEIQRWLNTSGMNYFIFDFYFPRSVDAARPIYLCCFSLGIVEGGNGYLNPNAPDVMHPYYNNALELNGPLRLAPNTVGADAIRGLLNSGNLRKDYLLFTPALNRDKQVIYSIQGFQRTDTGDVLDGDSIETNPSPPAMFQ